MLPCPALYRAAFLESNKWPSVPRSIAFSDFRSLIHLHGELLLGLYLEQDLADWLQGAQSTRLHEAEPMPLLWWLKGGGKSLFCSRCLRARDRISSESRSADLSSLPIQAVLLCTKWPAYTAGRRGRRLRRALCFLGNGGRRPKTRRLLEQFL